MNMKLIDTHQHLFYPEHLSYGWTKDSPALAGKGFRLADYQALVGEAVAGSICVEAAVDLPQYQDETAFISRLCAVPDHKMLGLVAAAYPERDGFDAWVQRSAADPNIVGYRRILHVVADELSQTQKFRQNVRKIGDADKCFDMCFLQRQLAVAVDLAKACDNTQLILDHCGNPILAPDHWDDWHRHMSELAHMEHVAVKISGLTSNCPPQLEVKQTIAPYIEACIDLFGWDRVVWGSDWPVVNLGQGLSHWLNLTHEIFAKESEANCQKLFQANAQHIYGIST